MGLVIGILTAFMIVDCLILILLVLMQLPKKEAGAGLAFGGAATDALFGAGSGNLLTKATKYAAGIFFAFAIFLSMLHMRQHHGDPSDFRRGLDQPAAGRPAIPAATPAGTTPAPAVSQSPVAAANTNLLLLPPTETTAATNVVAPTNSAAPK